MLSQEAFEKILGIEERVKVKVEDMADNMNITFYPYIGKNISEEVISFSKELREVLEELKVNIVPYDKALEYVPILKIIKRFFKVCLNNIFFSFKKFFHLENNNHYIPFSVIRSLLKRKKIKAGISVISLGENDTWNLPMDNTSSFTKSFVITIIDWPKNIKEDSDFIDHFNTSMNLFAHHMANIIIAVTKEKWLLYNFNASHPIYDRKKNFKNTILHSLVPKVVAPIRPCKFSDFIISNEQFDVNASPNKEAISDLVNGSKKFEKTNLYPPGKKIADLPFRNSFYKWIGSIHLDERSGMSFGFFARQLPTKIEELEDLENFKKKHSDVSFKDRDFLEINNCSYILLLVNKKYFVMKVPDVWVMSLRSGCNKTNFVPEKDTIKLGLKNGRMYLETPKGLSLKPDYKPSFDTKVILAHALGNAIVAGILNYFSKNNVFTKRIKEKGVALAHWHGYFHPKHIPDGWIMHGLNNSHVSCSSPQSAIYAIHGKLFKFQEIFEDGRDFVGDIHVEPHHGTNIIYPSLEDLADYLISNKEASVLGNRYLNLYNI